VRVAPFADWNRMEFLRVVDYRMPGILMTGGAKAPKPPGTPQDAGPGAGSVPSAAAPSGTRGTQTAESAPAPAAGE
jgi:hypothetical protein